MNTSLKESSVYLYVPRRFSDNTSRNPQLNTCFFPAQLPTFRHTFINL